MTELLLELIEALAGFASELREAIAEGFESVEEAVNALEHIFSEHGGLTHTSGGAKATRADLLKHAQRLAAADALKVAIRLAPLRGGALRKALKIIPKGFTCTVTAPGIKYFAPLTEGQKAHIILPRKRKALAFDWSRAKALRFKGSSAILRNQRSAKPLGGVLRQKKTGPHVVFFKRVIRRRTPGKRDFVDKAIREYELKVQKYLAQLSK